MNFDRINLNSYNFLGRNTESIYLCIFLVTFTLICESLFEGVNLISLFHFFNFIDPIFIHNYRYKQKKHLSYHVIFHIISIVCCKFCSIKLLSKNFSKALKLILNHMKLYNKVVFERSQLNQYWILENSLEFLDKIKDKSIFHMETYDFSTLYTALPHQEIKGKFFSIFNKVYKREAKPFINIGYDRTYFGMSRGKNGCSFSLMDMIETLDFFVRDPRISYEGRRTTSRVGCETLMSVCVCVCLCPLLFQWDFVKVIGDSDLKFWLWGFYACSFHFRMFHKNRIARRYSYNVFFCSNAITFSMGFCKSYWR